MKEKLSAIFAKIKNKSFISHIIFTVFLVIITMSSILLVAYRNPCDKEEEVFEEDLEIVVEETVQSEEICEEEEPEKEYIPVGNIRIPHCGDIYYSLASGTSDFYFENPDTNLCYLKVSITRLDTKETIYSSTLISPGNNISGIGFPHKLTKKGNYNAMIKVDAYALDRMVHLNSLAIDTMISVY